MKLTESRLFVAVRIAYTSFIVLLLIGLDNRRATEAAMPQLLFSVCGIFLAIWIARNYERGKNWARIWMFIANYVSLIFLFKEIGDLEPLRNSARLATWGQLGTVVDVACIIATLFIIVRLHKGKALFAAHATAAGDPDAALTKMKELLDKGLISQEDYDRRKAEILEKMTRPG